MVQDLGLIQRLAQEVAGEARDEPDGFRSFLAAREAGDVEYAREVLEKLLARDLRCIAAREMLGSIAFRALPWEALRYYESGMRVGDLSFSPDFHGALPWSWPGNRPFLRYGYGLCLWRQKQFDEAWRAVERLLVLDPDDHQGVRAASGAVERRQPWEEVDRGLADD
jgi:tetratricopeptide (TPR) repeat protein